MTAHVKICKLIFANISLSHFDVAFIQTKYNSSFATFEWMIHSVATGYNSHIAVVTPFENAATYLDLKSMG